MDVITSTFLVAVIAILLFYFLQSNHGKNSSIPYVTYKNCPLVGHLFSFIADPKKFLMECQQRFGQSFKIRLFTQPFVFLLSPSDWTTIIRNQSFYFPATELAMQNFDIMINLSGKY